ncbi:cytochrome P450 [Micromonospora sp. HUAS LYJ1]|uniref:cytochrome P450 n=1 Tax=Micromonospora sp. HUAS LYJ1 TaxID=3061626 RepID=UPI002671A698|nr:cytochrome P450 [Micromonospora sp. HUAS LYJ1]WKU07086.1 cytochrome P450 [Micromonospora sp. HUAS LYJ1]
MTIPATAAEVPVYLRRDGFTPTPDLGRLRDAGVVERVTTPFGLTAWLLTRHDDVRTVLADSARFSNDPSDMPPLPGLDDLTDDERAPLRFGNLLGVDPPEHTRLRRTLTAEFTLRRMRALEPRVRRIVDRQLAELAGRGSPVDLVTGYALPVPSLVICELLGVPTADRAEFNAQTSRLIDVSVPVRERLRVGRGLRDYMSDLVRRARLAPGDDMIGMLIREHGCDLTHADLTHADLTHAELAGLANFLLLAGHETTANMLALGTLALLRHPAQLARVRDDPAAVTPAVEELLRWLSVVQAGVPRLVRADTEFGGVRIPAGDLVLLSLPAANRDPAAVERPDELDIGRGAVGHLAFGHGVHHCIGAPLARMELRVGLPALLRRFPDLRMEPGGVVFRPSHVFYGLSRLVVSW